jgi:hypothetical protein
VNQVHRTSFGRQSGEDIVGFHAHAFAHREEPRPHPGGEQRFELDAVEERGHEDFGAREAHLTRQEVNRIAREVHVLDIRRVERERGAARFHARQ